MQGVGLLIKQAELTYLCSCAKMEFVSWAEGPISCQAVRTLTIECAVIPHYTGRLQMAIPDGKMSSGQPHLFVTPERLAVVKAKSVFKT